MTDVSARAALTSSVRYWEPRRILYNVVLLAVVLVNYFTRVTGGSSLLTFTNFECLFVLAVVANVAYCTAYLPDVLLQMSYVREAWLKFRWALLLVGLGFAAILANLLSQGMFSGV